MMMQLWLTGIVFAALSAAPAQAQLFDPVFGDHAVLQREQPVRLWGSALPGERIKVILDKTRRTARAGADGRWQVTLPARRAGGPYHLEARGDSGRSQSLSDIAVGDVFLCSGQSNMEFPLSKSDGGAAEIASANDPMIRLAAMPPVSATLPIEHLAQPLLWQPATPASVADFSAVCWYMARALQRTLRVPFGLIDASWGGSTLQAWLSPAALAGGPGIAGGGDPEMVDLLALLNRDPAAANLAWGERWQRWWRETVSAADRPWLDTDTSDWTQVPALDLWETWPSPVLADFNGMVWYRTHIQLTAAQAAQAATLDIGSVDELDQTWVNGRAVGTGASDEPRQYTLPPGSLVAGENVITVNILDTWETGGMFGPAERRAVALADGTRIPLSGSWYYRKVNYNRPRPPRAPWHPASGQGTLYNGMIAPLGTYGLRAMAWYQGESNTVDRLDYSRRLDALFWDRRATFGSALPVLLVQLANYGPQSNTPVDSDWAAVREAQRRYVERDRRSGLAVTIDVGNPKDIHPTDKRTVGERLARSALAAVYGHKLPRNGPQPRSATEEAGRVVVRFRDLSGPLAELPGPATFEVCGPTQASCQRVRAQVGATKVSLPRSPGVTRVRYCWDDGPQCSLRDRAGALSPFEIGLSRRK
jgi:sialate O-acetylesterase